MPATDGDYSVTPAHEPVAVGWTPVPSVSAWRGQWREVIVGQGFAK